MFNALDKDDSGKLSWDEAEKLVNALIPYSTVASMDPKKAIEQLRAGFPANGVDLLELQFGVAGLFGKFEFTANDAAQLLWQVSVDDTFKATADGVKKALTAVGIDIPDADI